MNVLKQSYLGPFVHLILFQLQPLVLLAKSKRSKGSKCFAHLFFSSKKPFVTMVLCLQKNEGNTNKVRPLVPLYKNRQLQTNCSPQKQMHI